MYRAECMNVFANRCAKGAKNKRKKGSKPGARPSTIWPFNPSQIKGPLFGYRKLGAALRCIDMIRFAIHSEIYRNADGDIENACCVQANYLQFNLVKGLRKDLLK